MAKDNSQGITLISLVITIIVLVILASITVGVALGDDGLLAGTKRIEQVKKMEKYEIAIDEVVSEQYKDFVMEDKVGSIREKTKEKINSLDFVQETKNGSEENEIDVITKEPYLIVVRIDNGNTDVIHEGEYDNEPLPVIVCSDEGKDEEEYKIKVSATVEKTEKTTKISSLKLVDPEIIIDNYNEGEEVFFKVDKPGKYWIEATTNIGKRVKESVIVKEEIPTYNFDVILAKTSYTYDGTAKEPLVTVKDGDKILTKGTHYIVEYSNNINAGTATVKVTGKGNYIEKKETKTFTIDKANATNPTLTNVTAQYDGKAHTITVSGGNGGTIYYRTSTDNNNWGEWTTTKPSRTDVGTTYIQAYVKGDVNHNDTSETESVTIEISQNVLTIKHYLENANDTKYTLVETTTNTTLKNGQSITLADYKKTDIPNGKNYKQGSTTEGGTAVTTATMGTNTTIYLYYSRDTYALILNKGNYISEVIGAGTYKVGQSVKIDATIAASETGYTNSWVSWTSSNTSLLANTITKNATITMPAGEVTLTANGRATAKTVEVTFMRNSDSNDTTSHIQTFTYGITGQKFSAKGWTKDGYALLGWSKDKNATSKTYSVLSDVTDGWKVSNSPAITLYAVWAKAYYQNTNTRELYVTLSDAIANSGNGTNIKVIDNVASEKTTGTVDTGKTLTLDLNGKTVIFDGTNQLENKGTLTIIGSGKLSAIDVNPTVSNYAGTLNVNMTNETSYNDGTGGIIENKGTNVRAIENRADGTVNINSGTIVGNTSAEDIYDKSSYAIANNMGTLNINGGTVRSISSDLITQYGIYSAGTLNVKGGTIEAVGPAIHTYNTANATISGGNMKSGGSTNATGKATIIHNSTGELKITGNNKIIIYNKLDPAIRNMGNGVCTIDNPNAIIEGGFSVRNVSGTMNIKNGQFNAFTNDGVVNDGIVNITGGTIKAKSIGVMNVKGTMNITGGKIDVTGTMTLSTGSTVSANSNSVGMRIYGGEINISGGTILGNNYGIIWYESDDTTETGKLNITGGKIQGGDHGIVDKIGGIITLGKNDSTVSQTSPEIIGTNNYGIYRNTTSDTAGGYLSFYDGIIKGKSNGIAGDVKNVPTGYTMVTSTEDNMKSTVLKKIPTMTVSSASKIIQDGSSSTFTYTYDGDGAVTVKSSDTSIATCSVNTSTKTVTVNALKTSTKAATITVSAADGTNYTATSATVQIGAIVISGVPTSWTKNDVELTATTTLTGHRLQMMGESGTWQTTSSQTFTKNGTLSVRVLDSSLTSVGTKSVTITKIDKTAPEISAYDATVSQKVITASMTATDNCGVTPSYSYKIGTGSYQASNKFTVTTAGTYTIYFRAVDAAGNEKVVSKQVTVT